jgi:hypothetical protein
MGLDTTHNAWHGPYSSFNRFRHELAKRIGINLVEYNGYSVLSGDHIPDDSELKDLESIDHPLMDLFNHSDCDGELTPKQCLLIAKGLEDVILKSPIPTTPEEDGFIERCMQFRDGCMLAVTKQENLEFH